MHSATRTATAGIETDDASVGLAGNSSRLAVPGSGCFLGRLLGESRLGARSSAQTGTVSLSDPLLVLVDVLRNEERGHWNIASSTVTELLVNIDVFDAAPRTLAFARGVAAFISAGQGEDSATTELSSLALADAAGLMEPAASAWARAALARLALGQGKPDEALRHLDEVAAIAAETPLDRPWPLRWQGDWLDALLLTGETECVRHLLDGFAPHPMTSWHRGVAARSRAMLAVDTERADALFDDATNEFGTAAMPFELARTYLARGARFRLTHARSSFDLAEAGRLFARLGARDWLQRTVSEIARDSEEPEALLHGLVHA